MYCKNCGKLLAGDERFCSNCGSKVEAEAETIEAQEGKTVEIESFPTSNMVWDLEDFEEHTVKEDSDFEWGAKDMFSGEEPEKSEKPEREQDAADYKGPLMFRKEDKAPSREEIEKKEKAEESSKKSTLYADDGHKGQGHRWDITKVEIPAGNVELEHEAEQAEDKAEEKPKRDFIGFVKSEEEATPEPKKEFIGFAKRDDEEVTPEPKKEFVGFAKREEVNAEAEAKAAETKEELQAVLDQAIDQAIEKDFPSKKEKKDIVFNWNQNVDLPTFENHVDEGNSDGHKESLEMVEEDVVDNNMSLTLEELAAGVNIKSDNVPASNYDESKKTIRNVLSKEAIKQTISFSMDEINAQQEKIAREEARREALEKEKAEIAARVAAKKAAEEAEAVAAEAAKMEAIRAARRAERAAKLEAARAAEAEKAMAMEKEIGKAETAEKVEEPVARVVDIEQPKKSNISLEIQEDDVTGDKIEKVIDDEPKVPEESLKSSVVNNFENTENNPVDHETATDELAFTHKEINDDIKVGQVNADEDIMEQILSPSEEVDEDDDKVRFYTFNKNKEEFQKLLDQEYRRLEGENKDTAGVETDVAGFMNIERGKNVEATSQIEEMNKARSVFLNRPTYGDVSVYEDDDFDQAVLAAQAELDKQVAAQEDEAEADSVGEEPAVKETKGVAGETVTEDENATENVTTLQGDGATADVTPEKVRIVFEPQKDESLVETLIEKEKAKEQGIQPEEPVAEVTEPVEPAVEEPIAEDNDANKDFLEDNVGKIIIDPKEMSETEKLASEFFDEEDDVRRRSKGKNFLLGLLTIIIVIVIALLGIKIIIPESPIAKVMDDIGNSVVEAVTGVIGGDEGTSAEKDSIRETVIEDKTELIQSKIDKNYNNNIEEIVNDDNLVYDSDVNYDLADLVDAKDIQTVLWYEDNKGVPYYYDEEIVGSIIEFVSMKSAWQNKEDKAIFSVLNAGTEEYDRIASLEKNSSEELVSVLAIGDIKVAGNAYYVWTAETVGEETVQRVYEIKEQDQKLYVNDDCEI